MTRALREGALWGGALTMVLALHLGAALWIMHQAEAAAPPGLADPVFVELVAAGQVAEEPPGPAEEAAAEPTNPDPVAAPDEAAPALELPPLAELATVEDMAELFPPLPRELETPSEVVLNSSARPQRRPEGEPEPRRQAQSPRQEQPAPRQQQARRADQGAAGRGLEGPSPQQKADLMARWGGQIRACISRRVSAPRGVRQNGRVILRMSVLRSGSIQGVGIAGSSGIAALDQAALQAAQRAGRCPAAPAGLMAPSFDFDLPITLQLR